MALAQGPWCAWGFVSSRWGQGTDMCLARVTWLGNHLPPVCSVSLLWVFLSPPFYAKGD